MKTTRQETGYVIIDEPFWKTAERLLMEEQNHSETEEQANVIRHTGCAILDSGASQVSHLFARMMKYSVNGLMPKNLVNPRYHLRTAASGLVIATPKQRRRR